MFPFRAIVADGSAGLKEEKVGGDSPSADEGLEGDDRGECE